MLISTFWTPTYSRTSLCPSAQRFCEYEAFAHSKQARAIPTFTEPVELLQRRARSFVWFRLNRKRSKQLSQCSQARRAPYLCARPQLLTPCAPAAPIASLRSFREPLASE